MFSSIDSKRKIQADVRYRDHGSVLSIPSSGIAWWNQVESWQCIVYSISVLPIPSWQCIFYSIKPMSGIVIMAVYCLFHIPFYHPIDLIHGAFVIRRTVIIVINFFLNALEQFAIFKVIWYVTCKSSMESEKPSNDRGLKSSFTRFVKVLSYV